MNISHKVCSTYTSQLFNIRTHNEEHQSLYANKLTYIGILPTVIMHQTPAMRDYLKNSLLYTPTHTHTTHTSHTQHTHTTHTHTQHTHNTHITHTTYTHHTYTHTPNPYHTTHITHTHTPGRVMAPNDSPG